MPAEAPSKAWDERRSSIVADAIMRFSDAGLVLGAGTVLAAAKASARDVSVDPDELRLAALLTAAHLRRPTAQALVHLRRAAECRRSGDDALAAMHLVLSRVDRLSRPDSDAHRLFLADELLNAGVSGHTVIELIETDASALDCLGKGYNPEEPRVPAGNGIQSGRWTTDGGGLASNPAEANANTVTPAADHKSNSDTGRIAMNDCIRHMIMTSLAEHHNDNWKEEWIRECQMSKKQYDDAEYKVETNPKVTGGIVGFPDGGLIIMRKGRDDVYIPAAPLPPLRRSI